MTNVEIVTGDQIDCEHSAEFLRKMFAPAKSHFLIQHGNWLYRGVHNSWYALIDGTVAGCCAVIPVDCAVAGERVPALWWVDLVVDPQYRGRGIQSSFDVRVRAVADLKLGFPNELAAKIHRKHNWGVREDGHTLLLPLRPRRLKQLAWLTGVRKAMAQLTATGMAPLAALWRRRLTKTTSGANVQPMDATVPHLLSDLFERNKNQYAATTYRDADYWQWRYLEAPYVAELRLLLAGPMRQPSHCMVIRCFKRNGYKSVRILDWFGDRHDLPTLRALARRALAQAVAWDAAQVTVMNFDPALTSFWRRLGFVFGATGRFCWHAQDQVLMTQIGAGNHWMLGDSDNDAPE